LRGLFWRIARRRYHGKVLTPYFEYWMYAFSAAVVAIFALAYWRNPERTSAMIELLFVLALPPLVPALMHWRVRHEMEKGRNALVDKDQSLSGRPR